ncbi:unnamed protein product, partial [Effrenium voratum]
ELRREAAAPRHRQWIPGEWARGTGTTGDPSVLRKLLELPQLGGFGGHSLGGSLLPLWAVRAVQGSGGAHAQGEGERAPAQRPWLVCAQRSLLPPGPGATGQTRLGSRRIATKRRPSRASATAATYNMSLCDRSDTRHSSPTRSPTSTVDVWSLRTFESPGIDKDPIEGIDEDPNEGQAEGSTPRLDDLKADPTYPRQLLAADLALEDVEDFETILNVDGFFSTWLSDCEPFPRPERSEGRRHSWLQHKGQQLVLPAGPCELPCDGRASFVCRFFVQLEEDEEFCLVKRLLGKGGCNMKEVAENFNAKVRLRGIGSGFLEANGRQEAPVPLEIHVSCKDFGQYLNSVATVAITLQQLYRHYARYARSKGLEGPLLKVKVEELRRSDHGWDPRFFLGRGAKRPPVGSGPPVTGPFTSEVGGGALQRREGRRSQPALVRPLAKARVLASTRPGTELAFGASSKSDREGEA